MQSTTKPWTYGHLGECEVCVRVVSRPNFEHSIKSARLRRKRLFGQVIVVVTFWTTIVVPVLSDMCRESMVLVKEHTLWSLTTHYYKKQGSNLSSILGIQRKRCLAISLGWSLHKQFHGIYWTNLSITKLTTQLPSLDSRRNVFGRERDQQRCWEDKGWYQCTLPSVQSIAANQWPSMHIASIFWSSILTWGSYDSMRRL